jgi:hypothetical protein
MKGGKTEPNRNELQNSKIPKVPQHLVETHSEEPVLKKQITYADTPKLKQAQKYC